MRKITDYVIIAAKGIAMGAADVIPGVSGGTIAFISGIYGELVDSIKSIDLAAFKLLFTGKFGRFWKKINGNFLLAVALGIAISIFSLAKLMTWLLVHYPIVTWAFFFGLIVASAIMVARDIPRWTGSSVVALVAGVALAYAITILTPASTPETWWFVMLAGAIAICAMILPGISGAFILLLLGKYQYMLSAVSEMKVGIILIFILGAFIGIVSFSHLLSWLLRRYRTVTIALLTGFMIGSLNKVWPWKETLETYTDRHGAVHPLVEANVTPAAYEAATGAEAMVWPALLLCIVGFALIFAVEYAGKAIERKRNAGR